MIKIPQKPKKKMIKITLKPEKKKKWSIKTSETQIMTKMPLNMQDDQNTHETSKITEIKG